MNKTEEVWVRKQMQDLVNKWKGENPPFMSKEYIDMRFDRLKYLNLKKKLAYITAKYEVNKTQQRLIGVAKEVFNIHE